MIFDEVPLKDYKRIPHSYSEIEIGLQENIELKEGKKKSVGKKIYGVASRFIPPLKW